MRLFVEVFSLVGLIRRPLLIDLSNIYLKYNTNFLGITHHSRI